MRLLFIFVIICALATLVGCGGNGVGHTNVDPSHSIVAIRGKEDVHHFTESTTEVIFTTGSVALEDLRRKPSSLVAVHFQYTELPDKVLVGIGGFSNLERFELSHVTLTAAHTLRPLADIDRLNTVILSDVQGLSDEALEFIPSKGLQHIIIERSGTLGAAGYNHIAECRNLKELVLRSCGKLSLPILAHVLESVSSIRRLVIEATAIDDARANWEDVPRYPSLTSLILAATGVDDDIEGWLEKCDMLESVDLSQTIVTTATLIVLARCPRMKKIIVRDCPRLSKTALAKLRTQYADVKFVG